jgi:membrane-bound serine protease (ClpP class)
MAPGSVIGAEESGAREGSALRKRYVATAEQRGRDPRVAEAMVTGVVTVAGLNEPGQALTLTSEEAFNIGFAAALVPNVDGLLEVAGFDAAQIVETSPSIAEDLVRILTNPIVAALLFAAGLVLLVGDLLAGGISLLAALGFLLITVFFWGHFLAGLAGWEGVALVGLGVLLIGVEAFVLPGFGVAGIAGVLAVLAGFYISMIGGEIVTRDDYVDASGALALVVIVAVAGAFAFLWLLPGTVKFHGMVLSTNLSRDEPVVVEPEAMPPASEPAEPLNPDGLTEREIDVLRLIAAGRTNQEAADELHLSVRTIERHVTNLYAKIGASNRAEATAYAFRENFA